MKCDFCDEKATIFLTQLIDGEMKKRCLCEQCAADQGVTDPLEISLSEGVFSGVVDPAPADDEIEILVDSETPDDLACAECGFSMADLKKIGRLGCPECYQTFRAEIIAMLPNMHKGGVHIGKVPAGLVEEHERSRRLDELKAELDKAINEENYEEAARFRDEIQALV